MKVIRGQSKFSAEQLTSLSAKPKDELEELKTALEAAQQELDALQVDEVTENEEYDRLIGWADVYDCSFETKRCLYRSFSRLCGYSGIIAWRSTSTYSTRNFGI